MPLLFLLYINDLHKVMMHCSVHYFADNEKVLLIDKSLKKINKHINHDLKHFCQWIKSNRLSLNGGKTKIIIFRNSYQQINKNLNFQVSREKINPTSSVRSRGLFNPRSHVEHLPARTYTKPQSSSWSAI